MYSVFKIDVAAQYKDTEYTFTFTFSTGNVKKYYNNKILSGILFDNIGALGNNLGHIEDIVDMCDWVYSMVNIDIQNVFGGQALRLEEVLVTDNVYTVGVRKS